MKKAFAIIAVLIIAVGFAWANWPGDTLPSGSVADRVVIVKRKRELILYHGSNALKRYDISLGRVPSGPKEKEGDKKTPEGVYRITEHKGNSAFHLALRISYPEEKDLERAKVLGVSPGADIMIHGIRNGLGLLGRVHRMFDWTAGCIAVTNPEIEEIFAAVPNGALVEIRE